MQFSVSIENEGRSRCEFTMTVMHRIGIVRYCTSFKYLKQTRQKKMKSVSGFTYVCVGLSVLIYCMGKVSSAKTPVGG